MYNTLEYNRKKGCLQFLYQPPSMFYVSLLGPINTNEFCRNLQGVVNSYQPTAFATRTLCTGRYSVGEHEASTHLFACEKWCVQLWSWHITLYTDHPAVATLLSAGPEADTHYAFPAGVLLYCNFTVQYCKASNNIIADGFSRLHLQLPVSQEREEEIVSLVTPRIIEADLQAATTEDTTLQQVLQFIANG